MSEAIAWSPTVEPRHEQYISFKGRLQQVVRTPNGLRAIGSQVDYDGLLIYDDGQGMHPPVLVGVGLEIGSFNFVPIDQEAFLPLAD